MVPGRVASCLFREPSKQWLRRIPGDGTATMSVTCEEIDGTEWDVDPRGLASGPSAPYATALVWRQRNGRDLPGGYVRWYAGGHRLDLEQGGGSITIPLDPGAWSSVFGKPGDTNAATRDRWRETFTADELRIGICFGGIFFSKGLGINAGSAALVASVRFD